MTETMERRPEIGFASYDRFFPSQDTMPVGGFGNLIACRCNDGRVRSATASSSTETCGLRRPMGVSGRRCHGYRPMPSSEIRSRRRRRSGRILGVRMPVEDEDARRAVAHDTVAPQRSRARSSAAMPSKHQDRGRRSGSTSTGPSLPPALTARLIRLAAFQNPEFYRAQAMRSRHSASLGSSLAPSFIRVMWRCPGVASTKLIELITRRWRER